MEPMQSYLVESYMPKSREADCHAAAARAREAAALGDGGSRVRYVRFVFVAEDETCFHVFEGTSSDAIAAAIRRAGIDAARIVPATLEQDGVRE